MKRKTTRISGRDPRLVAEEYVCWQAPHLTIVSHKFEDALQRKYQRVRGRERERERDGGKGEGEGRRRGKEKRRKNERRRERGKVRDRGN